MPRHSVVVIVSKDTAVRIKAESLGICAEDYRHDEDLPFSGIRPCFRGKRFA